VMKWRINLSCDCDGHPGCGTIEVRYEFSSGVQGRQHPSPGQPYIGTQRDALLPNDGTGQQALALLRRAFRQGKCFAVGSSATTGRSDVVVWRIHQKTSRKGGPTQHGWPDATYLDRLKSECAAAAVAEEGS
jgi:deltex-like protein